MAYLAVTFCSLFSSVAANPPWPPHHGHGWGESAETVVTVDTGKRYQPFDGMGFAEAFQRGTQIYGADGLSEANTSYVLDLLYSNKNGAGMTILRNGIGSSLTNPYDLMKTIEPNDPGSPDSEPTYDWQGTVKPGFGLDSGQLRVTKDAIARGVQTVYADAWSAPGFMKNNSNENYGGYLCGVTGIDCDGEDWRQAYADYLVKYLMFYKEEGIHIDYVGFLNEPDLNVSYASMLSDGQQAADFLEVFYPTLQASGLDTEIACCDGSGWDQSRERIEGIQAAGAENTLGLVTSHGYESYPDTPFDTQHKVWETEWADLNGEPTLAWYANGSSGEGLTWANNIHQLFAVSNASAALYWIGADNTTTNSALILLDGDTVHVSKRLWAFGQYSRFVKPGATRIDVSASDASALNMTAFENSDGSVAVQIINNGDSTENVRVAGLPLHWHTKVSGWLTNNDHDLTYVPVGRFGRRGVHASVPPFSMMSIVTSG
ncbi:hypothetical protein KC343_g4428 [Hortaea werneckii]|uniref:Glycosyl hydrolase family 30 beta sandwich domain-containing protein n=1 Tax=Hortaea werneckii TaxID=91943 RepID=A0A3M7GZU6_HORWE|nr:hypothetical protein KC338_g3860 [Hortaea werneckii]KAI7568370.1 hypothetical protein KC317_g4257 [Hortaea werneckii]KAI7607694.1 hypothetical protein KC346_g9967 [Hortaea werneckii]KAI7630755.1 hypothetical protein KC343_g4428 [Hortaea werneckii]KAI7675439.1 hypothetical protein KC319_g4582 [Hortaea werneckii]